MNLTSKGAIVKLFVTLVASVLAAFVAAAVTLAATDSGPAKLQIRQTPLGRILVDAGGRTLYDFPPDKRGASTCYGACAALWPPLLTSGKPIAGRGVRPSLLGTTRRKDGKLEVTYNKHPLYYFVSDRKPGQTTGQGLNQFGAPWWVLSPAGKEIHGG
jgi:predicted lipoprotein with Yx(FWY)xxD motif